MPTLPSIVALSVPSVVLCLLGTLSPRAHHSPPLLFLTPARAVHF